MGPAQKTHKCCGDVVQNDVFKDCIPAWIIQLLTTEVLDRTWYPPKNTNTDRGDSRVQYWYSVVDINVISNTAIVKNGFTIQFVFLLITVAIITVSTRPI